MSNGLLKIVHGVTDHWRQRWIEWTLGFCLIGQGLRMYAFQDVEPSRIYNFVYAFINSNVMMVVALVIGVIWISALFINGRFHQFRQISPWFRVGCSFSAMLYWAFWAVTLYKATQDASTNAWINHATLSFMALMTMLTLADEVAAVDRKAQVWRRHQAKIGHR